MHARRAATGSARPLNCSVDDSIMLRVTIDTNCINAKRAHSALNRLEDLARQGVIELTTTFVMAAELASDRTRHGEARRQKAARLKTARSGFMVGRSAVGGPDLIGGPDAYAHVPAISAIIRPGVTWDDIDKNTQRDILFLSAHRTYGWEMFVTSDTGILECADALATVVGIRVKTPDQALIELEAKELA
jgi:hypothetical protein